MFDRPTRTDLILRFSTPHPHKTLCHWHTQVYEPTITFHSIFFISSCSICMGMEKKEFSCHRQFKLQLKNQEVSFSFPTSLLNCVLCLNPTTKLCIPSSAENFNVTKISLHEYSHRHSKLNRKYTEGMFARLLKLE